MLIDNARLAGKGYLAVAALYRRSRGVTFDLGQRWPRMQQRIRIRNPRRVSLGSAVAIRPYSFLKANGSDGAIRLGAHSMVGELCILNAVEAIEVGEDTLIALGCHLTDANHRIEPGTPIRKQGLGGAPIRIGNHVWIGSLGEDSQRGPDRRRRGRCGGSGGTQRRAPARRGGGCGADPQIQGLVSVDPHPIGVLLL